MIGFVASPERAPEIREALFGLRRDVVFERITLVSETQAARDMAQEAARLPLEVFLLDLGAFEKDATALGIVRHLRFFRDAVRIVVIAPGRLPGDRTMAKLTHLGVWDILIPPDREKAVLMNEPIEKSGDEALEMDESLEVWSLADVLREQLASPPRFADAARWQGLDENGGEAEERLQIVERDRIVGVPVIAFCGVDVRCGSTTAALGCASFLSRAGFRVAAVELSNRRPSGMASLRIANDAQVGVGFRITRPRLDLFPACAADTVPRLMGAGYDYVVLDAGMLFDEERHDARTAETLRADQLFICAGPTRWDQERLVRKLRQLRKAGREKLVRVLAHFCDERYFRAWSDTFNCDWPSAFRREAWPPVTFHRMPLRSDPLDASGVWDEWLVSVLPAERLPYWSWHRFSQLAAGMLCTSGRRSRKKCRRREVF